MKLEALGSIPRDLPRNHDLAGGIRNRQIVYEILSDDEQLNIMSAEDLMRSHRRTRGRSDEDLGHDEILGEHQKGGDGNHQLRPLPKRRKMPPASQPELQVPQSAQTAVKIWIDDAGDIQTDGAGRDQDNGWQRLKGIWKGQVEMMNDKNENLDYSTVDLKSGCLHAVGAGPAAHFWTKNSPGQFACRTCANTGRLCFVRIGGRLEALPLPALSEREVDRIDNIFVVKEGSKSQVSRRYPGIWSD